MVRVSLTPAELRTLIRAIERDAELAEREGQVAAGDHLARRGRPSGQSGNDLRCGQCDPRALRATAELLAERSDRMRGCQHALGERRTRWRIALVGAAHRQANRVHPLAGFLSAADGMDGTRTSIAGCRLMSAAPATGTDIDRKTFSFTLGRTPRSRGQTDAVWPGRI